ncbi:hypothetical protein [Allopontixanthobacter sediminis]|uniref:hypothetical protein n=1 Tax=Allopontixanthobacter sediminis TaxID=1689985 RepID=UPI001927C2E3|nr:hypothetical protein [Allopontixanthobacter sediminis]
MTVEGQKFYPGHDASAEQIAELADEYRQAAANLAQTGRLGARLSLAPCRLVSLHAIELYLNAILIAAGRPADQTEGFNMTSCPEQTGHSTQNLRSGNELYNT